MDKKINLAVIFGSRSVEHEVSIVTALQILENADKEKYNLIPIYIDKQGQWHTGKALFDINNFKNLEKIKTKVSLCYIKNNYLILNRIFDNKIKIDVAFPAIHGTFGEDGTIQGFFEMANIPYVGSGITGSAVGMDKILQKDVLKLNGLSVVNYTYFLREDWIENRQKVLKKIQQQLKFPVFVKPANLGSSIGISKAKNQTELQKAIELAINFDRRIIVEQGLENIIEINCSVMGYKTLEVSICEQPLRNSKELLSYEDKYLKGSKTQGMASLSRLIPAPISPVLTKKIQDCAKEVFRVLDAAGVARIDFLVDPKTGKFYTCEINTIPGSFAFYLWEKSGYPFPKLIDKLVELALERFNDRKQTQYSFSSNLLQTLGSKNSGLADRFQKV